ncbi:MAG: Gldg family protein [Bauldia sp.]
MSSLVDRLNQINRGTLTALGIVLAIVLFLAANMLVALAPNARLDLTQDQLFTPTESTVKVLRAVREPITLHLYQSTGLIDTVPTVRVFSQRVNEILRRYEDISGGKVRVNRVDPVPFSPEEDRALGYDLQGFNLNSGGDRGYFGLVGTNSVDQVETIKFLDPAREPFLEYDLTRIVNRLSSPRAPKVGIMDGLGIFGDARQQRFPSQVLSLINRNFDIQQINLDVEALPDDLEGLMVVHPTALTPRATYAIDQYVLNGGPLVVFVDPLAETSAPNPQRPNEPMFPTSSMPELFKAWGIEMPTDKVVGDRDMAIRVVTTAQGGRQFLVDYLPLLQVRKEQFNDKDIVTSRLGLMRIGSAGSIRQIAGAQTAFTPLIATTTNSTLLDQAEVKGRATNPQVYLDRFKPSGVRQVLAARVSGPANTAFPTGQPPATPSANPDQQPRPAAPKPQVLRSVKPINVIVVADTDMLNNNYVVSESGLPNSNNADFVINALDNITGGTALLELRGRGLSFRPFTTVEAMERAAQAKFRATEEQRQRELDEAQSQLKALQGPNQGAPGEFGTLTQAQQETIARANRRILQLREQLRDVRASLNADIEDLQKRLQVVNILLIPILVALAGVVYAVWRRVRLSRYIKKQAAA